jgi:hypothetical protein
MLITGSATTAGSHQRAPLIRRDGDTLLFFDLLLSIAHYPIVDNILCFATPTAHPVNDKAVAPRPITLDTVAL